MSKTGSNGRRLRVAVLMGGNSNERAVSLSTGKMILNALDPAKYAVKGIDTQNALALQQSVTAQLPSPQGGATENGGAQALTTTGAAEITIREPEGEFERPDVVFIALHGRGGEDGTLQGMLECLGLPYTGSGVLASALAMDKAMSKKLFRASGIPVIEEIVVTRGDVPEAETLVRSVMETLGGFPVFVKPNSEGSTVGCALVEAEETLAQAVAQALKYDKTVLIEKYIKGKEITVGVLGNAGEALQALPVIEIVPKAAFYDYESKYADGGSEHIIPARLTEAQTAEAQALALRCHDLLGCRGMSRTDLIATDEALYVLEVNTIPGMTPTSLLPQAAEHAGIPFPALLDRLIQYAMEK